MAIATSEHILQANPKTLDTATTTTHNHTGASRMHFQIDLVSLTLNAHLGDPSAAEVLIHVCADFVVFLKKLRIAESVGEPAGAVLLGNAEAETNRINFLSHVFIPCLGYFQ